MMASSVCGRRANFLEEARGPDRYRGKWSAWRIARTMAPLHQLGGIGRSIRGRNGSIAGAQSERFGLIEQFGRRAAAARAGRLLGAQSGQFTRPRARWRDSHRAQVHPWGGWLVTAPGFKRGYGLIW
jgi:hypothetical protein